MRVAIVLILVATLGAAVPAVYYDLWFVVDNVHVATVGPFFRRTADRFPHL